MQIINWYPGHIAKAIRKLKDNIKLVDLVIEMVDSRLPVSSHFPVVDEILNNKSRLVVINKIELADRNKVSEAVEYWKNKDTGAIAISLLNSKDIVKLRNAIAEFHVRLTEKLKKRGVLPRPIRVMVLGLPNIGKSTLINRLVTKKTAKVGNMPGITRHNQWVRIGDNIELLDTPGIIPPKFDDQLFALKLVIIGAVSTEAYEPEETSRAIMDYLQEISPALFEKYEKPLTLEKYGQSRNFLKPGGGIDIERASKTFLKEIKDGKFGSFSLE